mmetsp:Transcript_1770/g.4084  ORF Transcript_1770/g.4084 Transcript_1770/m.4084 type:complete len:217 (-) Transcript_1770:78-728(-)
MVLDRRRVDFCQPASDMTMKIVCSRVHDFEHLVPVALQVRSKLGDFFYRCFLSGHDFVHGRIDQQIRMFTMLFLLLLEILVGILRRPDDRRDARCFMHRHHRLDHLVHEQRNIMNLWGNVDDVVVTVGTTTTNITKGEELCRRGQDEAHERIRCVELTKKIETSLVDVTEFLDILLTLRLDAMVLGMSVRFEMLMFMRMVCTCDRRRGIARKEQER